MSISLARMVLPQVDTQLLMISSFLNLLSHEDIVRSNTFQMRTQVSKLCPHFFFIETSNSFARFLSRILNCQTKADIGSSTNPEASRFYIRDIGSTTGSFIMVRSEILLKQNMMFQMGLSEFKVIMTSKKTMIELHVFEGPAKSKIFTVDELGCGIGRDQSVMNFQHQDMYYHGGNTFCVKEDSQMSNHHARITYHKGGPGADGLAKQEGFYLADVGSTNRTWLRLSSEGEQSNLHPLKVNDILKIGSTVFVVQTNDIGSLKNMPIINKRVMGVGGSNSEEEKNAMGIDQINPGKYLLSLTLDYQVYRCRILEEHQISMSLGKLQRQTKDQLLRKSLKPCARSVMKMNQMLPLYPVDITLHAYSVLRDARIVLSAELPSMML